MGRMLIAGNWKMNGLQAMGLALAGDLAAAARGAPELGCELLVCPPAQLLLPIGQALAGSAIALGAQDCHSAEAGAHTGDISAAMLADAGCRYVIVGHSERRADHGETDGLVRAKAVAAQAAGLVPIVCLGETENERLAGRTLEVVADQLAGSLPADAGQLVVAYEPVWAIGTGRSATPEDVRQVHGHLRGLLTARFGAAAGAAVRLLYGGSVKAANAAGLLAIDDVDGALVGGASLAAEEFWAIAGSCP